MKMVFCNFDLKEDMLEFFLQKVSRFQFIKKGHV